VEFLYSLFSRLLDRKIEELRMARSDSCAEDDIKDDYMGIIGAATGTNDNGGRGDAKRGSMMLQMGKKLIIRV
jgi:hypothetical protein